MKSLLFCTLLLFSTLTLASQLAATAPTAKALNSVVAIVNNDVITNNELTKAITAAKAQLAASQNPGAISESKLRDMVLQQLIDEKLVLEVAKRANMTVTDEQVTQAVSHIAAANHMTLEQLKSQLQAHQTSYTQYRQLIQKQILIHEVEQSAIGNNIHITPQDIQNARIAYQSQPSGFESFHLIDILCNTQQDAQNTMLALKAGKTVQAAAPDNATDLGWQTAATLPTIFIDQIAHMQPGDIAGPVQAPNGFHVIKLIGVRGGNTSAPTQAQLQNLAFQMQSQKAVKKWLKTLRKTAYIEMVNQ